MFKKKDGQINTPVKGLNKDSWALGEADYNHAQNANFDNFDGGTFNLTNEMSNILASKFKVGFKVIGVKNDIVSNNTYFFLVNPTNDTGEFGVIESNQNTNDLEDLPIDCEECTKIRELAEPLETLTQIELQTYTTLISDSCKTNKLEGFNFNINYPIKTPIIKNEKCGKTIYFTDNYNAPRYINISKLADYFIQDVPCGDNLTTSCADFEKMRIFKKFSIPELSPVSIELGGRLPLGVYQFLIAYCDALGNEISEYYSITNPISIFDLNKQVLEQTNLADETNYAIRLDVKGLDNDYSYYKIAVIQTADLEFTNRYFIEGVHTIDDTSIVYSSNQGKVTTSIYSLARVIPKVEKTESLAVANNILFHVGITNKKELNLQPAINLLGQNLKWQTHIAPENLYESGIATSIYKGFNREEVVPFGIKFGLTGGFETAIFPFIGREPNAEDLEEVAEPSVDGIVSIDGNNDVDSILQNVGECNETSRLKRWQYFNTAKVLDVETCEDIIIETIPVEEELTKYCTVENIAEIPAGTTSVQNPEDFLDLTDYININRADTQTDCEEFYSTPDICNALYADYSAIDCPQDPFINLNCGSITEGEVTIEVQEIQGEVVIPIEKVFSTEYQKMYPPSFCSPYLIDDETGEIIKDSVPTGDPMDVFVRNYEAFNEDCNYAIDITEQQDTVNNSAQAYFNNFYYDNTLSDLYTTKTTSLTASGFYGNIHKGALWFVGNPLGRDKFIFDISKQKLNSKSNIEMFYDYEQKVRVSIFKTCGSSSALYSSFVNMDSGGTFLLEKINNVLTGEKDLKITDELGVYTTIANGWSSTKFYVVIDNKINFISSTSLYIVSPTSGCYTVTTRNIEYSRIDVSWDKIILRKKLELISTCIFDEPVVKACKALPYKKGNFAYWESTQTYPDNNELYNSATLLIKPTDIPVGYRLEFEEKYTNGISFGNYIWKLDGDGKPLIDYTCRNIRHFKFPNNTVAPFIDKRQKRGFSPAAIFPLGVTIDEELINVYLDIAKNNGLISQEDRDNIVSYEIVRGDLTTNRSIIASGLLYDMRKYQEKENKNKYLLYSNYPYNSYSEDKLNLPFNGENRTNLGEGAVWGESNRNYTFHSPETDYIQPTVPSELSVQGYMFGQAKISFDEVKDHPKWVILTQKARSLASTLATLEVIAETTIQAAQASANYNPIVGTSNTTYPGGLVAAGIILGFKAASGAVFNYGKYRYVWLKIFKEVGSPQNFAYYSFSEGDYNYLLTEQTENSSQEMYNLTGNTLRGINTGKYLKEGRFTNTNPVTAEKVEINNIDRETSVFISTGKFPIEYPETYRVFDKDTFTSSITYSGENGVKETGRSEEILRNIASPYVYLKNYIADQHGTINSVRWLSTGYRGDLTNPKTSCISIFGGDTFITRHTLKRKHSQFLVTSMKQADRTPFNYYFYNNIGRKPKFWVSYEIDRDFNSNGKLFPDIDTDVAFDVETKGGNYYRPPSRFYLYYYGVPSFLCETRINTNFRYAGKELSEGFYPQVGDLGEWTQEKNVPIRTPNVFNYNSVYSKNVTSLKNRMLSDIYNKEDNDCKADFPNGVISSLQDVSENSLLDPWLVYRPLDFYEFPTSWGKLKEIKGIESGGILGRFENTVGLFNVVDTVIDDGKRPDSVFLGAGNIFARRPVTFSETELGYGGTQTSISQSCEFGHFHVDAKRGQVIQVENGGKGIQEISSFAGDKPSGMRNWFKEHLPFKILNSKIEGVDVDNAFNGIGITMGWDSRFRRLFITKKDYKPLSNCIEYVKDEGFFLNQTQCNNTPQISTCPEGYTYNNTTQLCEKVEIIDATCVEDIPQYRSSWIISTLDPSAQTTGDEVDIRTKTPLEIKCLMAQNIYEGYGGSSGVYHFNSTLQVGDVLYANNTLPLTIAGALTGNYLIFSPYSGSVVGTPNPTTDKILTINTGVITAITMYNQLPNC